MTQGQTPQLCCPTPFDQIVHSSQGVACGVGGGRCCSRGRCNNGRLNVQARQGMHCCAGVCGRVTRQGGTSLLSLLSTWALTEDTDYHMLINLEASLSLSCLLPTSHLPPHCSHLCSLVDLAFLLVCNRPRKLSLVLRRKLLHLDGCTRPCSRDRCVVQRLHAPHLRTGKPMEWRGSEGPQEGTDGGYRGGQRAHRGPVGAT